MRTTTARHQINVIPIGSIKSPLHNLPPLPAGNKQGRLVTSLIITSCPEAEERGHWLPWTSSSCLQTTITWLLWECAASQPSLSACLMPQPQGWGGTAWVMLEEERKENLSEGWPNSLTRYKQERSHASPKHTDKLHRYDVPALENINAFYSIFSNFNTEFVQLFISFKARTILWMLESFINAVCPI